MHATHLRSVLSSSMVLAALLPAVLAQTQLSAPFAIVRNDGQWNGEVGFSARHHALATTWFVRDGFVLDLRSPEGDGAHEPDRRLALRLRFDGMSNDSRLVPGARLPAYYNYFIGSDPDGWRSRVPSFETLRYASIYPGVDAVVREGGGLFAYDLHLAAGVDPGVVVVRCDGARDVRVAADGALVVTTAHGDLRQSPPVAWQDTGAGRRPVRARFVRLDADCFGFAVRGRDPRHPLVIDPDLTWSTYIGGSLADPQLAIDKEQTGTGPTAKVTILGRATSTDFPTTTGALQTALAGGYDNTVSQFDPGRTGSAQLLWATYIGGRTISAGTRAHEAGFAVRLDVLGNVMIAGSTKTTDYPTTANGLQTTFGGGEADGFLSQLDRTGSRLMYSTFFGGTSDDWFCDLELSGLSVATVVGFTNSDNLTTVNPFQATRRGMQDLFVATIDPNRVGAAQLRYATYLGGTASEGPVYTAALGFQFRRHLAMDLDGNGRILLAGSTASVDYPTINPYQATNPNVTGPYSGCVTVLDPTKAGPAQLVYSTYLGGTLNDHCKCAAFAQGGQVVVAGQTTSAAFPVTAGAFDTTKNGTTDDVFVTWLDPAQNGTAQLTYSTFLGGAGGIDRPFNLLVDSAGTANVCGLANSGFPTTPGAFQGTAGSITDGFFCRVFPGGQGTDDLVYSTLFGGGPQSTAVDTWALDSVLDGAGGIFLCGRARSAQHPTTPGAFDTTFNGGNDGFAAHFWGLNRGVAAIGASSPQPCAGDLMLGARGFPTKGNTRFELAAWGAQNNATGFLGVGLPPAINVPVCAATLVVNPILVLPVGASASGEITIPAPIAPATPTGTAVVVQLAMANGGCCLTTTNGLRIDVFN